MLLAQHTALDVVAFGAAGTRSAAELSADAAHITEVLPAPAGGKLALLAIRRDRYVFMATVLGAWARGYDIVIPVADVTREQFLQLAQRPEISLVLHDTQSTAPLQVDRLLAGGRTASARPTPLSERDGLVYFGYDATTPWRRSQLISRTLQLAHAGGWPARPHCVPTLLPETPYGVMLGCFWPLLSGGAFYRDDSRSYAWLSQRSSQRQALRMLVSVPAHIRRALRAPERPLSGFDTLVSAEVPLPDEARAALAHHPHLVVHDLYGELPRGVAVSVDADSLAERIAWALGVDDAAVWLGGEIDGVDDVAVLDVDDADVIEVDDAAALDVEAAAAVLLEDETGELEPTAAAQPEERRALYLALRAAPADEARLRSSFAERFPTLHLARMVLLDASDAPRGSALPCFTAGGRSPMRGGAGSYDRASLLRVFGLGSDSRPLAFELHWPPSAADDAVSVSVAFSVHVPANYGYFAGHFPGYPILPGAAQLSELVLPCVRRARPGWGRLTRMSRVKFSERIVPDDDVDVVLTFAAAEPFVDFALRRGAIACATGRLAFATASEPQP